MDSIGEATMEADGTIILDLRVEILGDGFATGDARFVYRTSDSQYKSIFEHISPIKPGESKLCPPWK